MLLLVGKCWGILQEKLVLILVIKWFEKCPTVLVSYESAKRRKNVIVSPQLFNKSLP